MGNIAIIPARGGSKGLPGKNIRPLNGKPLIVHSIEQAVNASCVSRILVSTDDEKIADIATQNGAEVIMRPSHLATDTATTESAIVHALDCLSGQYDNQEDAIILLQCTSPLRTSQHIDSAYSQMKRTNSDSLVSVTPWHGFNWARGNETAEPVGWDLDKRLRRQDMQSQFRENGSIFIFSPKIILEYGNRLGGRIELFVMDDWTQFEADTLEEFLLCEWIMTSGLLEMRVLKKGGASEK